MDKFEALLVNWASFKTPGGYYGILEMTDLMRPFLKAYFDNDLVAMKNTMDAIEARLAALPEGDTGFPKKQTPAKFPPERK